MSILRLHVAALALAVATSGLLAGAGSGAASANGVLDARTSSQQRALALSVSANHVRAGQSVRVYGSARPHQRYAGKRVVIEARTNGWRPVRSVRLSRAGQFPSNTMIRPPRGTRQVRLRLQGAAATSASTSRVVSLVALDPVRVSLSMTTPAHDSGVPTAHSTVTLTARHSGARSGVTLYWRDRPNRPWNRLGARSSTGGAARFAFNLSEADYQFQARVRHLSSGLTVGTSAVFSVRPLDREYHDVRGTNEAVALPAGAVPEAGSPAPGRQMSDDGRYVVYRGRPDGDAGAAADLALYRWDRRTGESRLITSDAAGLPAHGSFDLGDVAASGRFVAFRAASTNLRATRPGSDEPVEPTDTPQLYLWDADTSTTVRVPGAEEFSASDSATPRHVSITADARRVAYSAQVDASGTAREIVVVWDRRDGRQRLVSGTPDGALADADARLPQISANGGHVAFVSAARDLTADTLPRGNRAYRYTIGSGELTVASPAGVRDRVSIDERGVWVAYVADRVGFSNARSGRMQWLPATADRFDDVRIADDAARIVFTGRGVRTNTRTDRAQSKIDGVFVYTTSTEGYIVADGSARATSSAPLPRIRGISRLGDSIVFDDGRSALTRWTL